MLFGLLFAGTASDAAATTDGEQRQCSDCYRIDGIVVEGLLRTHRHVVERELLFEEGEVATVEEVEESIQRLRNTGIFRSVSYEFVDENIGYYGEEIADENESDLSGPDEGRLLRLIVDERFTISPSFRFGQGGDTFRLLLGLQDVNVRGRYLQAGGRYSRLGDANSFALWFRDPRFLDRRQQVSVQAGVDNRIYSLYDDSPELEGGFLLTRRYGALRLGKEWHRWFRTGAGVSFSADTFSYDLIGDARRQAQEDRGGLTDPVQTLGFEVSTRFGRLDYMKYRVSGTTLDARVTANFHFGAGAPRSQRLLALIHHFVDLPLESTLGIRGVLGMSSVQLEHQKFFAGGLDAIRGTFDNRHRGRQLLQANVELRVPTFTNQVLIVQNVVFLDAVNVTPYPSQVFDVKAVTTGLGLRLISRDFHSLIVRVDYALPIFGADGPGLSFGAGQFF